MTNRVLILTSVLMLAAGCSQKQPANDVLAVRAPDITDGWEWSPSRLKELNKQANNGDIAAVRDLYDYYSVWEYNASAHKWETWLINHGDSEALGARASEFYSEAKELSVKDPRKLALLREVRSLTSKKIDVSLDPDAEFLERVDKEIADIEKTSDRH